MTDNKNQLRDLLLQNLPNSDLREWLAGVQKSESESAGWNADCDAVAIIEEARRRELANEHYVAEQPKFIGPLASLGYLGTLIEWGMVLATLAIIGNALFG